MQMSLISETGCREWSLSKRRRHGKDRQILCYRWFRGKLIAGKDQGFK
jgi:hypothetical protein